MKGLSLLRALTPAGWLAVSAAGLVVAALLLGGLGFRWDPFDLDRRRLAKANEAIAHARAEAAVRTAEASAQAGQVARLDTAMRTSVALERATSLSIQDARTADDATEPLPADRVDRLRDHDRELCRLASALEGCSAEVDSSGGGGSTLRPVPAS